MYKDGVLIGIYVELSCRQLDSGDISGLAVHFGSCISGISSLDVRCELRVIWPFLVREIMSSQQSRL